MLASLTPERTADGSSPRMQMYLWNGFGTHEVVAKATATEVVQLKIASRFGKAQFVKAVVITVRPDEHVDHLAVAIVSKRG